MKKLGILLLAAALAVCGLMTFAACNEETLGPGDDPIVTPGPDDPTASDEPEATEGLVFELLTTENSDGFEVLLGEDFEDCYMCYLGAADGDIVVPSIYNGLSVRVVRAYGEESDAFNDITSLYIPDSVQLIQWNEYDTFESLTEIRLPRNPNAMISGGSAFSYCAFYNDPSNWDNGALYMDDWLLATNGDLPEEYTVKQGTYGIAAGAFLYQDNEGYKSHVKKVTVPDGVQSLVGSFANCASLEEAMLPDSLSSIGYVVFHECSSLTSITIPDSVTFIGEEAFYGCSSLMSITIPDSVTSIGYWAFKDCSSLKSIAIPDAVTSIGSSAFYNCVSLTSVTIPDSVTSIGSSAFCDCDNLTSINIPDSPISIGSSAFEDTAFYKNEQNWEGDALYIGKHLIELREGSTQSYSIKEGTITISDSAFYHNDYLKHVSIPDSVEMIGSSAFCACYNLENIVIPDSVTCIGDGAFVECTDLTSVTIGDGVTCIGDSVFYYCYNLTSVTIGDGVTCIGESAFAYCSSLTSIVIPDSVTIIGDDGFFGCGSLTSVVIPDSVTSIGGYAFGSCISLESITIPDSVTSIGNSAFSGCSSLESVIADPQNPVYHSEGNCLIETKSKTLIAGCGTSVIPADGSVTFIGDGAFSVRSSLTSITIPDSVTSIGDSAFAGCESLESITIPDSVTSIGDSAFAGCESLESITIPDSVTSIGDRVFSGCESLMSVTIGDGVTEIGGSAFYYCSGLTSITIPDSVISIGSMAFEGCESLETVYYRGSEAEWNEIGIRGSNEPLLNSEIVFNYTGE